MALKNFYIVLGVPQDATDAIIRAAYRDLAKRHHPDIVGEAGTRHFQEIVEAYGVLSDPKRRRAHNRELDEERSRRVPPTPSPSPPVGVRAVPEPLVPEPLVEPPIRRRPFEAPWPGDFATAPSRRGTAFDVLLSRRQARDGGTIPIQVATQRACPRCRGSGRDWMFLCFRCAGRGRMLVEETVAIPVPPGVRSGTVIDTSFAKLRLIVA